MTAIKIAPPTRKKRRADSMFRGETDSLHHSVNMRCTSEQIKTYRRLGGNDWLRALLDAEGNRLAAADGNGD